MAGLTTDEHLKTVRKAFRKRPFTCYEFAEATGGAIKPTHALKVLKTLVDQGALASLPVIKSETPGRPPARFKLA